jgi:hypothetical protein
MGKLKIGIQQSISILDSEEMINKAYEGLLATLALNNFKQVDGKTEEEAIHVNLGGPRGKKELDVFMPILKGIYIPGSKRDYWTGYFDLKVDTPPDFGSVYLTPGHTDVSFNWITVVKIKSLPKWIISGNKKPVLCYKTLDTHIWKDAKCPPYIEISYFTIDEDGAAWSAFDKYKYRNGRGNLALYDDYYIKIKPETTLQNEAKVGDHWGPGALSLLADRKYLWNIRTMEPLNDWCDYGQAIVDFGVEEEIVKSLAYARSLPLTATGRKRPILHWVQAHLRRIKSGIDIDIRKYLRGITDFSMGEINFSITSPCKE